MFCSSCGVEANNLAEYCSRCGNKLPNRSQKVSAVAAVPVPSARTFPSFLVPAWIVLVLSGLGVMLIASSLIEGSRGDVMFRDVWWGAALLWTAAFGLRAVLRRASTKNYFLAGIGPFLLGVSSPLGFVLMLAALTTTWLYRKDAQYRSVGPIVAEAAR